MNIATVGADGDLSLWTDDDFFNSFAADLAALGVNGVQFNAAGTPDIVIVMPDAGDVIPAELEQFPIFNMRQATPDGVAGVALDIADFLTTPPGTFTGDEPDWMWDALDPAPVEAQAPGAEYYVHPVELPEYVTAHVAPHTAGITASAHGVDACLA